MAGQHMTDDEWMRLKQPDVTDDEIEDFEERVSIGICDAGLPLEKSRQAGLECVLRKRKKK
jgi:hypothetical protein